MKASRRAFSLLLLVLLLIVGASMAEAQPKGWPCDYGYRPGNTWFYRSMMFPEDTYSITVLRDSVDVDGRYWVCYQYSDALGIGYWYRIDSTCTFDLFLDPQDLQYQHRFIATADSGIWWVVDSAWGQPSLRAFVYRINHVNIFGTTVRTHEIVYYFGEEPGTNWRLMDEWAEGLGIIARRSNPTGYDVLIGAIIDGRKYGTTSGTDDGPEDASAGTVAVYPMPTSNGATVRFIVHAERSARLTVHDMLGRNMQRVDLNELNDGPNTVLLNLAALPAGAYMVTVEVSGAARRAPLVIVR